MLTSFCHPSLPSLQFKVSPASPTRPLCLASRGAAPRGCGRQRLFLRVGRCPACCLAMLRPGHAAPFCWTGQAGELHAGVAGIASLPSCCFFYVSSLDPTLLSPPRSTSAACGPQDEDEERGAGSGRPWPRPWRTLIPVPVACAKRAGARCGVQLVRQPHAASSVAAAAANMPCLPGLRVARPPCMPAPSPTPLCSLFPAPDCSLQLPHPIDS